MQKFLLGLSDMYKFLCTIITDYYTASILTSFQEMNFISEKYLPENNLRNSFLT